MEIAHFILSMGVGGGEKLVRRLSQNIKVPGYTNRVICFDSIDAFEGEFYEKNIPLDLVRRKQIVFDFGVIPSLVRMIRRHKIKLIHAHDLTSLSYGVVAGRLTGAKVVMTEHSRHYIDVALKRRMEKWVWVMAASCLVEVSPELMKASLSRDKIPGYKIFVIENGVDIKTYGTAEPVDLHGQLGIPRDHKICLTVGRLESIKGQQYLIEAMGILKDSAIAYHLVLVGDGANRSILVNQARQAGISEFSHFLGTRVDIPQIMAGADFLVIPSESEGLPFVLLEAMASGLPVIASRVGRIPGIIGENERGVLVNPKSSSDLAAALVQFFQNKNTLALSQKAHAYIQKKYSEQVMLDQYKNLYQTLLM